MSCQSTHPHPRVWYQTTLLCRRAHELIPRGALFLFSCYINQRPVGKSREQTIEKDVKFREMYLKWEKMPHKWDLFIWSQMISEQKWLRKRKLALWFNLYFMMLITTAVSGAENTKQWANRAISLMDVNNICVSCFVLRTEVMLLWLPLHPPTPVTETVLIVGWLLNKSTETDDEFSTIPTAAQSLYAHELVLHALLSRAPHSILTLWLHVDHVHVEFCSRKDLISLSQYSSGKQRVSYLCIIVSVYLTAAGFWQCMWYLLFLFIFSSFVN